MMSNNHTMTELNLSEATFSSLSIFNLENNVNISSVSLRNIFANQASFYALLDGGGNSIGIGEIPGVTELDLSGIDFMNIQILQSPLYMMDDLTDLWIVNARNLDPINLNIMLRNLDAMEGSETEGILYLTQTDFNVLNDGGRGKLAAWDAEPGHHVAIIPESDFNNNGIVNSEDFNNWLTGFGIAEGALRRQGDANIDDDVDGNDFLIWQQEYGSGIGLLGSDTIPEPTSISLTLTLFALVLTCYRMRGV